eukprot:GHUV01041985.1.p2 GENE.GHUV01041985.1~~GHUV01041985.1.p2  ORF type:complete len:106 (+),score=28.77 GHUV01041985.1:157-474(+)
MYSVGALWCASILLSTCLTPSLCSRPELMEASAAWARGARFADVLNVTPDVFEGSLVRAVRRTEELMRQVAGSLRGVGDIDLAGKFDDASAKIKRDIIFAASLYL